MPDYVVSSEKGLKLVQVKFRRRSFCFQAEDGIRDLTVTGVQTCALPIFNSAPTVMSISEPFIRRPIATSLLMAGIVLMGLLGYFLLPVSALPPVDFPTIQVTEIGRASCRERV